MPQTPPESLEPTVTPVGRRIRSRRQELGLSQADIAEGMLSPSYVSLVESGRRQPAAGALAHVAEKLGVDVEFLRDGVDASVRAKARLALSRAQMALRQGSAREAYDGLTNLVGDPGLNDEQHRQARLGRALALERLGDLERAIELLNELADEARSAAAAYPWLDVAVAATRCYRDAGDIDMAVQLGEQAMADASELGLEGTDEYVRLGSTVFAAYYVRGDYVRAKQLASYLVRVADDIGTPQTRGAAYWNASIVAESRGELAQALQLVDRAVAMFGESDDQRNLARLRVTYAELLLNDPSADHTAQALELLDSNQSEIANSGTAVDVAASDLVRARALLQSSRLEEAQAQAEKALASVGDHAKLQLANARLILAQVLQARGDSAGSIKEGTAAAAALDDMGTSRPAASAWRRLADLYRELGRNDEALDAYDRALRAVRVGPTTASIVNSAENDLASHADELTFA